MKTQCPSCAKSLAVPDAFAGRRVKCPGCGTAFQAPIHSASGGVTEAAPRGKSSSCPQCGEPLSAGATECEQCGWVPTRAARASARRESADEGEGGLWYVVIRRDEVELTEAVVALLEKFIETEGLDARMAGEDKDLPDEPGPDGLVLTGKVTRCTYGNRFLRYFLGVFALLGAGSCDLDVSADVETDDGDPLPVRAKSRMWIGVLGGSGEQLMQSNVKNVAKRLATEAVRRVTGRRFLNAHVYDCASWSLGLGVASLLPFVGAVLGLIGLVLGLVALVTISSRQLPRGKARAVAGVVLPWLGFAVTAGTFWLVTSQ